MIKSMNHLSKAVGSHASNGATLFSSSLPVLPHDKRIKRNNMEEDDAIGNLLPDEDELLSGIMDGLDLNPFPNHESDEIDLFGGMELELEPESESGNPKVSLGDGIATNGIMGQYLNGIGTVAGEHPYGEHPSRTLFVRNINSNVEDSELRILFEQYGDIRTLYTACKHRGFVMISYYDIRAARTAMRALQNKPLRRRKLDIHYSIPKDNPSDKDMNQGTLVVFNLDPSVSCEDLLQIFGAYGEVKEIRETPHKRHHKFIEYYDVRAAEAALRSLNRSDIAGKRIKLEPSRPGGARRNLMLQINQEFEQDDTPSFRLQVGTSIASSPPGVWPQFGSPIEQHSPLHNLSNSLPGLASILHSQPTRIAPIGKDHGRSSNSQFDQLFPNSGSVFQQSRSLQGTISSFGGSSSATSGIETLSGPQFLWGSPSTTSQPPTMVQPFSKGLTTHGFSVPGQNGHFHHHGASAPSGIPLEQRFGQYHDFMSPSAFGGQMDRGFLNSHGSGSKIMEKGSAGFSNIPSPRLNPLFLGNGHYPGIGSMNIESRNRRVEYNGNQVDNKKQFQLDLDKITSGEDTRTTLMIKNIPNKYTSKMLLASIDEIHSGTYDFLYLPIDFKNKCNVGYAFINMLSPMHIIPFYQVFNGKKWEKFNSEKVASLAYARIQGKAALVTHFQNSSLMNEDKRCRPILFHSEDIDQDHLNISGVGPQAF